MATRRTMLKSIAALGAVQAAACSHGQVDMPTGSAVTIDLHHHMLPDFYIDAVGRDALAATTPVGRAPSWSPEIDLAMMDAHGVDKAVLSISPGLLSLTGAPARTLSRRLNEYGAALCAAHPARYGQFAVMPLPDIDAALAESAFALDSLGADGVLMFSNYSGRYLGDPMFEPLYQELNRRSAIVFVHPTIVPYQVMTLAPAVLEFPFDTTRTIASLVLAGVTQRHPNIRFIFSHAGGTMPFLAGRLDGASRLNPRLAERFPQGVMPELRKLYWDTALTNTRGALLALLELTDSRHIVFGSDFPFAPTPAIELGRQALAQTYNAADLANVMNGTAISLIPRLA